MIPLAALRAHQWTICYGMTEQCGELFDSKSIVAWWAARFAKNNGMNLQALVRMKEKESSDIIPGQQTGKAIDAETTVELAEEIDVEAFFANVKNRLQNVNQWKEYAGNWSARFQLVDNDGVELQRNAQKGDYIKIDIPGPGSKAGQGYDWVRIEEFEDTSNGTVERYGFRVRPTDNPLGKKKEIAHFYSEESTSSFIVERNKNKISVSVHDRNTKPNSDAGNTTDKIRDAVVGTVGAISFSKIQWKTLTEGLLTNKR